MNNQFIPKFKPLASQDIRALVFLANSGGLANRLRALVGYQALAKLLNLPFFLHWEQNAWCDARFTDLFDSPEINLITDEHWDSIQADDKYVIYNEPTWFDSIFRRHAATLVSWSEFLRITTEKINDLKPQSIIDARVKDYLNGHNLSESMGVHIRWTDNVKNNQQRHADASFVPENVSRLEVFFNLIKNQLQNSPGSPVFIATDNNDVQKQLHDSFGKDVWFYPKTFSRSDKFRFHFLRKKSTFQRSTPVREALIEMLLLSKCQTICGTYYSSFGKFCALWGDKDYCEVRGQSVVKDPFTNSLRYSQLSQNHVIE